MTWENKFKTALQTIRRMVDSAEPYKSSDIMSTIDAAFTYWDHEEPPENEAKWVSLRRAANYTKKKQVVFPITPDVLLRLMDLAGVGIEEEVPVEVKK